MANYQFFNPLLDNDERRMRELEDKLRQQERNNALSGFVGGGNASFGTQIPDASLEDLQMSAGRNAQRTQMVENLLGQVGNGSSPYQQNIQPILQKLNEIADNPGPDRGLIDRLIGSARSSSAAARRNASSALTEGTLGRGMDGPAFAAAKGLIDAQAGSDLTNDINEIELNADQQGRSERAAALDALLRGSDAAQQNTIGAANLMSKLSTPIVPGSASGRTTTSSGSKSGSITQPRLAGTNSRTGVVGPVVAGTSNKQLDMIRGHQKYLAETGQDVARTFNGKPFFGFR